MTASADDLVTRARSRITRVAPEDLDALSISGGLVVDIRPAAQRRDEGELPGAIVVERNVLEWRLDPAGVDRLPAVTGYDQPIVVVCSAGYASSLAAASLVDLGLVRAADLRGGYQAWARWSAARGRAPGPAEGRDLRSAGRPGRCGA